jgi:hypothetical protein
MSLFLLLIGILILAVSLYLYSIFSKPNQVYTNNYQEFEEADIDRDVDEMPDDCLIYNDLFDEE